MIILGLKPLEEIQKVLTLICAKTISKPAYLYLSACLWIRSFVRSSVRLSVYPFARLSTCLSVCLTEISRALNIANISMSMKVYNNL